MDDMADIATPKTCGRIQQTSKSARACVTRKNLHTLQMHARVASLLMEVDGVLLAAATATIISDLKFQVKGLF